MGVRFAQAESKTSKKDWAKHIKSLKENPVYTEIIKRISESRKESHINWLSMHQENIGRKWHERMFSFDEVLGYINDIELEVKEAENQDNR